MESFNPVLDLSRPFLPEALAGLASVRALDGDDRRRMNQIHASSYLHIFDVLETCIGDAAHAQAARDEAARDALVPLLRLGTFDHDELFHAFERAFEDAFPVAPRLVGRPVDLDAMLDAAEPLSLLVLALHLKLVTQQHYLACVRGAEGLEPSFVRVLKDHWCMECAARDATTDLQHAITHTARGRVPAAMRDYEELVFGADDMLRCQCELDVETLEACRGADLSPVDREAVLDAQLAAHRKTFLSLGIVNAGFLYAIRSLGPAAPATLAGIVRRLRAA